MASQTVTPPEEPGVVPIDWASPKQQWLYEAGPQPTLLLGGYNAAKTTGAVLKLLRLAFDYPRSHLAVVRKTYKQLTKTTMQTFYALLDPGHYAKGARSDGDGYLRLNNGTEIFFIHLDAPNSLTLLSGLELNSAFVDQAEELPETAWDTLENRIGRWRFAEVPALFMNAYTKDSGKPWPWNTKDGKPIPPPYLFATANPPGDEIHWLYDRFSEESEKWQEKYRGLGYQYQRTDSRENKFALQHNIDTLMAHDEDYIEQFVAGNWVKPKGNIFRIDPSSLLEWDPQLISLIRNTMPLARALDHGDSAPTCCLWFAVDGEGNIFCFQEYYQPGMTKDGREVNISDHRRTITQMSEGLSIRTNVADPSIFYKSRNISGFTRKAQRWSIADEYRDRSIIKEDTAIFWTDADNGEPITRSRLKEHLRVDPMHRHPITGDLGAPHLYFIVKSAEHPFGCDRVIREIKAQKRVQVGENDGKPVFSDERDPTVVDHAYDACKYFVVSHPMPAYPPTAPNRPLVELQGERVIITVPPITSLPIPREYQPKSWRSRAGGY